MTGGVSIGPVDEFCTAVEELRQAATFLDAASRLRPRLNSCIAWERLDKEMKQLIQGFLDSGCDAKLGYEGLVIRLSASFEWYLRGLVYSAVETINQRAIPYNSLGQELRNHNRKYVGKALTTVFEPLDHYPLDFDAVCRDVGSCVPDQVMPRLSASAFAHSATVGLTTERIEKVFAAIGVKLDWDSIAGKKPVRDVLSANGTRASAKQCRELLSEIQSRRNGLAHRSIGGPVTDYEYFCNAANLLFAFAIELERELGHRIAKLYPHVKQS